MERSTGREHSLESGEELSEAVNEFVFRSTLRAASLQQAIMGLYAEKRPDQDKYNAICHMIYTHANDIRRAMAAIEERAAGEEAEKLRSVVKMLNIDKMVYYMGLVLIKTRGIRNVSSINMCFIRKTRKFWVHEDNVDCIIAKIIRHLPLHVFGDDGSGKIEAAISSVYFDTPDFQLYNHRIRRTQGAKALRIRRYGESSPVAYVELKTHEEDWTGEKSTKRRFVIHTKVMRALVQGEDVWEEIRSINEPDSRPLYEEVLGMLREYRLVPIVKTSYMRKAFQVPGDASIRISIDTNFSMWKGGVGKKFPYVILEVKEQEGCEREWIQELMGSSFVERVDKFSKYIHGCSVHYEGIKAVPYWFDQMGVSIKRKLHGACEPQEPIDQAAYESFRRKSLDLDEILGRLEAQGRGSRGLDKSASETSLVGSSPFNTSAGAPSATKGPQERMGIAGQPRELLDQFFENTASHSPPREEAQDAAPRTSGEKRIVVPVRVEPKVFFANERTFLSWLHFSIFIGGIGAALLGLGDRKAAYSGMCFMIVSVIFSLYALYLYIWRAQRIREKDPGPYDDLNGPIILVAVFLSAMVTSLFFKFPIK